MFSVHLQPTRQPNHLIVIGMRLLLNMAFATALPDICKSVKVPERECPLNYTDHIFRVLVKYGEDGMGDVKVERVPKNPRLTNASNGAYEF